VAAASQDSLFVSQYREPSLPPQEEVHDARSTKRAPRKRPLSPLPEHDNSALLDEIAPTAAAAKRRRIEAGETPVPQSPEPEPAPQVDEDEEMVLDSPPQDKTKKGQTAKGKCKKIKQEDDILELARRQREEAEALAAAKRKELEELPDDGIDYAAIRALHIIEECEVRFPEPGANNRSRDQEIADGRWDPRWNGRKNFKRFRKQGEAGGRQAPRIIISLEEVKPKEYGIGDDYWLEDESGARGKNNSQRESQTQTHTQGPTQGRSDNSLAKGSSGNDKEAAKPKTALRRTVLAIDSSDEEEQSELSTMPPEDSIVPETEPSRSRAAKAAERANSQRGKSQAQTQTQSQSQAASSNKRSAATDSIRERTAKRPRMGFKPPSDDSDDSDDALKFRFGRRR